MMMDKDKRRIFQAIDPLLSEFVDAYGKLDEKVFENKECHLSRLFQDIKSLCFLWIKNRSSLRNLDWKDSVSMRL